MSVTAWGLGGYDPDHPNGNVIETFVDNGDGTGVRTVYDSKGEVTSTEEVDGLPIPPPPEPTDAERIAELEAILAALLGDPP